MVRWVILEWSRVGLPRYFSRIVALGVRTRSNKCDFKRGGGQGGGRGCVQIETHRRGRLRGRQAVLRTRRGIIDHLVRPYSLRALNDKLTFDKLFRLIDRWEFFNSTR